MDAGGQGILPMTTGYGKTIAAFASAVWPSALQDGRLQLVVVAP